MLYAATPGFTSVTSRTLTVARRIVRSASFLYYKRAHAAFILVLILGAATVVPTNRSGSGSIQATARVVDGKWDREAAALTREILPVEFPMEGYTTSELRAWASTVEGERRIGTATVDVEIIPATDEDPTILQIAWTSN